MGDSEQCEDWEDPEVKKDERKGVKNVGRFRSLEGPGSWEN
jgi:hypothetical protein